jgi:hypothetical protein
MKVAFNPSTNYQAKAYQAQSVSMNPSFKCSDSRFEHFAQGLAFSVMGDLLAAEKGGWGSRGSEIVDILARKAEDEYAIVSDERTRHAASSVFASPSLSNNLAYRIYSAAKCFCENIDFR